jgi:inorganic triphosphatase YgiF
MARVVRSRLEPARVRIARLLERLGRTSFRDRSEREILVAELGRTIAELPSASGQTQTAFVDDDGELVDSMEAMAGVESAFRELEEPESSDAWVHRLARLESNLSLLLAAEEDLLEACAAQQHVAPAEPQLAAIA